LVSFLLVTFRRSALATPRVKFFGRKQPRREPLTQRWRSDRDSVWLPGQNAQRIVTNDRELRNGPQSACRHSAWRELAIVDTELLTQAAEIARDMLLGRIARDQTLDVARRVLEALLADAALRTEKVSKDGDQLR
jgi:hypothetical protein